MPPNIAITLNEPVSRLTINPTKPKGWSVSREIELIVSVPADTGQISAKETLLDIAVTGTYAQHLQIPVTSVGSRVR